MPEGYFPIKKIVCEGGFACFSGKNFGHMFVYHMYFLYVDACKGAQYVCHGVNFSIQQLHLTIDLFETIEIRGVAMHGFKATSTTWQVFFREQNYCVCQRQGVQLVICATTLN